MNDVTAQSADAESNVVKAALDVAGAGTWRWDSEVELFALSPQACTLLGIAEASVSFRTFFDLLHPADRARAERSLVLCRKGGQHDVDFRVTAADGRSRWLRMCGGDAPGGICGILIGRLRRTAIEDATSRLAAIVTSSDDAIVTKTLDGIVIDWNRGAETIFGYRADEIVGKSIKLLTPPAKRSRTTRSWTGSGAASESITSRPSGSARTGPSSMSR